MTLLAHFRRRTRRIAALAVTLFALNALGLALAPCAMAFAAPAPAHAGPGHCPECPAPDEAPAAPEAACAKLAKPALETRDAKPPVPPILVALPAAGFPVAADPPRDRGWTRPDAAHPTDTDPPDRYCRRLE